MARPKREPKPGTVGIKELKDKASAIIDRVERTRRPVIITRNNREVARIVPAETAHEDWMQRLRDSGLIAREATLPWSSLKLTRLGMDASVAIAAIRKDRDES